VPLEPVLAALVTLVGIGLATFGIFTHTGPAVAPGALLIFVGGGWLGISLARHDIGHWPGGVAVPRDKRPS
jgi:hypothetical protein